EAMQKKRNFYNTLGISACVILAYDPFLLLSVSFQLSYLAVIGIVFFHPKIYQLYAPKNRFIDAIWQLFCLSMAAQISTFPISLYYFHQFPMYFWLANLVVVPVATFMLQGSLLVVLTSFVPFLPNILGFLTEKLIYLNNLFVKFVQNLPFSLLNNIDISLSETFLMYLAMIFLILLFYFKEFKYAIAVFVCVIGISFLQISKFFDQNKQSFFTIFDLKKTPNLQFLESDKAVLIGELRPEDYKVKNNFKNFWIKKGVSNVVFTHFKENSSEILAYNGKNYELFVRNGKKFLLVKQKEKNQFLPDADFVIVSNNSVKKLADLGSTQFKMLIIDASNSLYYAKKLKQEADSLQISCHSVHEQGALVQDF
ncbi:MAG: ComEC/Rec2 family competence protein, partial [Bacteroidetes bacterium]